MTYLPTCLQIIFNNNIKINYLNHLTIQNGLIFIHKNDQSNGLYFVNKKYHPNHIGHGKIDMSKMTRGLFNPPPSPQI